jgi:hypothetical protein
MRRNIERQPQHDYFAVGQIEHSVEQAIFTIGMSAVSQFTDLRHRAKHLAIGLSVFEHGRFEYELVPQIAIDVCVERDQLRPIGCLSQEEYFRTPGATREGQHSEHSSDC